ncbi:VOC family protein [Thalassospiraceae bacterium LMO-JJ14]|nr:VOC family protein [Thalassospiraceae bacterium LMO-JJ14]
MKLDHINVWTDDLEGTTAFFTEVLGLEAGYRPPFKFPGAWLYGDPDTPAIVHLVEAAPQDGGTGPLDHVAFKADDFEGLKQRLEAHGYEYEVRVIPASGDRQIFFTAPFGLKIEVNFPPADA